MLSFYSVVEQAIQNKHDKSLHLAQEEKVEGWGTEHKIQQIVQTYVCSLKP